MGPKNKSWDDEGDESVLSTAIPVLNFTHLQKNIYFSVTYMGRFLKRKNLIPAFKSCVIFKMFFWALDRLALSDWLGRQQG